MCIDHSSPWKQKLFTTEDPIHLHKTLGILCLLSFTYRFSQVGADMGFASHPSFTIPTVILHLLLNLSSFQFRIPAKRIKEGTRIWPEYRLHSVAFLCRHLSVITLYWAEHHYQWNPNYMANLLLVLATMAAADLGSKSVRYPSSTIRDLKAPDMVKFSFSFAQMQATANILLGFRYYYSIQFSQVAVIQINPFLGTLRRKNLISHYTVLAIYAVLILLVTTLVMVEYHKIAQRQETSCHPYLILCTLTQTAVFLRMAITLPRVLRPFHKYLVWTCLGLALQYWRPYRTKLPPYYHYAAFGASLVGFVYTGYRKCSTPVTKTEK